MDERLIQQQEQELAKTGRYYLHVCFMTIPLLCILQRVADHQVDIIECCGHPLVQAFQHRHAKADVGHKVAVHHVIMQHLRTGIQHHAAVCAKLIEISRKDRRTNDRHCVLYSPLFFRKITPSVLPEHLF